MRQALDQCEEKSISLKYPVTFLFHLRDLAKLFHPLHREKVLMLVAACSDFLKPSKVRIGLILCQAWTSSCSKKLSGGNDADAAQISAIFRSFGRSERQERAKGALSFGVNIVGLSGSSRSGGAVYEVKWISLRVTDIIAMLMPRFLLTSTILEQVHMQMLWLLSWKLLLSTGLCLCSWKSQQG